MTVNRFKGIGEGVTPVTCGKTWANIEIQGAGQANKNGNMALKMAGWNGRDPVASITMRIGKQEVIGT